MPDAPYDQLRGFSPSFIHESGKQFTHACCDCGSAHNIKLTVLNEEEIEVVYIKNKKATANFRSMPTHGVLISEGFSRALPVLLNHLKAKEYKKARHLLKKAIKREVVFQNLYAAGEFLDEETVCSALRVKDWDGENV